MPIVNDKRILRFADVEGVYVNGCVARGDGSRFHAKAHAHTQKNDKYKGWICFLSEKRLNDKMLVLHEVAHILSGEGHTDKWRRMTLAIGGTLDAVPDLLKDYHKRTKRKYAKRTKRTSLQRLFGLS